MSKTSRELIEFYKGKLDTSCVFGMKEWVLTEALLQQLTAESPKIYTSQCTTKTRSFMGKHCTDCSDLITWCTGILRGSANYRETAREVRPIGTLNESMTGWVLQEPGHIGVYIGNGRCVEAKGISYGTVETRAQDTPWISVLELKDIDCSARVCESPDPPSHPTGWVKKDGRVRFYLEPERYVSNDWYQDEGQWFRFDDPRHTVRDNWYSYKGNWYYLGSDFVMVRGTQLIKEKPYCFNRDRQMAGFGTRFVVQVNEDSVLYFLEEESVKNSVIAGRIWGENETGMESESIAPGNTEGKTSTLTAYEDSEYTGGTVPLPDTKTGTTQTADSKVEQSGRKGTGGTYQTAGDGTAIIFTLTGGRRTAIHVAAEK